MKTKHTKHMGFVSCWSKLRLWLDVPLRLPGIQHHSSPKAIRGWASIVGVHSTTWKSLFSANSAASPHQLPQAGDVWGEVNRFTCSSFLMLGGICQDTCKFHIQHGYLKPMDELYCPWASPLCVLHGAFSPLKASGKHEAIADTRCLCEVLARRASTWYKDSARAELFSCSLKLTRANSENSNSL